jgi:hypothetical protein
VRRARERERKSETKESRAQWGRRNRVKSCRRETHEVSLFRLSGLRRFFVSWLRANMDSSRRRLAGDVTPSLVSRPRPRMRQHGQHVSSVSSIERAKKGAGGRLRLRENKGAFILAAIDKLRRVCVLSRESGGRLASPRAARRSSLFRRPQNDQAAPTMAFCGLKEKGLGGPTSREKRDKPKKKKKLPPWRSKMPACKPPLPSLRTTASAPPLLFHSSHPPHDAPFSNHFHTHQNQRK